MPFLSPTACLNAWPRVMPMSSTVWWSSMWRSPLQVMSRSTRPWRAIWSIMWSRKGTPVSKQALPVPSRLISTVIWVSRVFRSTRALRSAMETPSRKQACYCKNQIRRLYPLTQPESRNRINRPDSSERFLQVSHVGVYQAVELVLDHRADRQLEKVGQGDGQLGTGLEAHLGGVVTVGGDGPGAADFGIALAFYRIPGDFSGLFIRVVGAGVYGLDGVLINTHLFHFPAVGIATKINQLVDFREVADRTENVCQKIEDVIIACRNIKFPVQLNRYSNGHSRLLFMLICVCLFAHTGTTPVFNGVYFDPRLTHCHIPALLIC